MDVFNAQFIPPGNIHYEWKENIERYEKLAVEKFYYETDFGLYYKNATGFAIRLHTAKKIKSAVELQLN